MTNFYLYVPSIIYEPWYGKSDQTETNYDQSNYREAVVRLT